MMPASWAGVKPFFTNGLKIINLSRLIKNYCGRGISVPVLAQRKQRRNDMTDSILYAPMFGVEMRRIRKKLRLDQRQWGLVVCATPNSVSMWETGRIPISLERAVLARIFEVSPELLAQALDETGALNDPAEGPVT
jgi:DNA-binding transcriptional regulator YiaG